MGFVCKNVTFIFKSENPSQNLPIINIQSRFQTGVPILASFSSNQCRYGNTLRPCWAAVIGYYWYFAIGVLIWALMFRNVRKYEGVPRSKETWPLTF